MLKNKLKSAYTGLWILLTGALALFVILSFAEDVKLGEYTLKKGTFKETFISQNDESYINPLDTIATDATPIEEIKLVETDTVPKNIFLFGDSMTLNIALHMSKYAKQNGHMFHAVNWDSSNTKLWATTDTLSYFIHKYKPDFCFISLGSNEVFFKDPSTRLPFVKKIIETLGDTPFVWIGPPNWNEDTGINEMLEKICGKGRFFRSEGIELKRKSDHIHPTRQATEIWVDSIMRWMKFSSHPILAEIPTDSIGAVRQNIVILKAENK